MIWPAEAASLAVSCRTHERAVGAYEQPLVAPQLGQA